MWADSRNRYESRAIIAGKLKNQFALNRFSQEGFLHTPTPPQQFSMSCILLPLRKNHDERTEINKPPVFTELALCKLNSIF